MNRDEAMKDYYTWKAFGLRYGINIDAWLYLNQTHNTLFVYPAAYVECKDLLSMGTIASMKLSEKEEVDLYRRRTLVREGLFYSVCKSSFTHIEE